MERLRFPWAAFPSFGLGWVAFVAFLALFWGLMAGLVDDIPRRVTMGPAVIDLNMYVYVNKHLPIKLL